MTNTNATSEKNPSIVPFFILWIGQAISLIGSRLVQFAIIWWLTQETGSATILAAASLVGLVPQIVLGPIIGTLVDRLNRKFILFASDAAVVTASLGLAYLFWMDTAEIWHIFLLLFVRALGSGFQNPTMMATTTLMVPQKHLTRVQGMNQMLQGGLNIVAAPLGALVIAAFSMVGVMLIDVATAAFALLPLLFIAIPQPQKQPTAGGREESDGSMWQDMVAGFWYVRRHTGVLFLMIIAAFLNLMLTPAIALLPLLVSDHFNGQAMDFASLQMAVGGGILVGGILLSAWGGFKKRIVTSVTGMTGLGIGFAMVGLAPADMFFLAIGGMFFSGLMVTMTNGPLQAVMQVVVPPNYQGRVFTLMGTMAMAMTPIGLLIAGPISDLIGIRVWFIIGGAACVGLGLLAFTMPTIMNLEEESTAIAQESNGEKPAPTAV